MLKSLLCGLFAGLCSQGAAHAGDYLEYEELQALINQTVEEKVYTREELEALFSQVSRLDNVLTAIARPAESKEWRNYRPNFLTAERIDGGLAFWEEHRESLEKAEKEFGVPIPVIIAIIGVETRYGRNKGNFRVLESLTTLAMDYPPRAPFFRKELREFLKLSQQEGISPWDTRGSYAGAMGLPQFMPSSWSNLAVDYDGDGKRDLLNNPVDAIGSVANYFQKNGWQPDAAVAFKAHIQGQDYDSATTTDLKTASTLGQLREKGLTIEASLPDMTPASALRLQGEHGGEFWITLDNFYVITRYNRSNLYAMAVWQLSEAIRQEHEKVTAPPQAPTQ